MMINDKMYKEKLRAIKGQLSDNGTASVSNALLLAVVGAHEIPLLKVPDPANTVLISITEPSSPHINPKIKENYVDTLEVQFWDILQDRGNYKIISDAIATKIRNFILKYSDKRFAIHCKAGISRSAGVAMAVECLVNYNGDKYAYATGHSDVKQHWRYMPNLTVFNKVIGEE